MHSFCYPHVSVFIAEFQEIRFHSTRRADLKGLSINWASCYFFVHLLIVCSFTPVWRRVGCYLWQFLSQLFHFWWNRWTRSLENDVRSWSIYHRHGTYSFYLLAIKLASWLHYPSAVNQYIKGFLSLGQRFTNIWTALQQCYCKNVQTLWTRKKFVLRGTEVRLKRFCFNAWNFCNIFWIFMVHVFLNFTFSILELI
jgi:hypothetical protein